MPFEKHLCTECLADLPKTYYWSAVTNPMAVLLNGRILKEFPEDTPPYVQAVALYFYEGNYKKITRSLKYHALPGAAVMCGKTLGSILAQSSDYQDIDCIIPVPLHPLRRLSRGYNQAEIIAQAISDAIPEARMNCWLKRSRYTLSQARLKPGSKSANVSGAFKVVNNMELPHHILIVDDVCTTGSTLCECHKALYSALTKRFGKERTNKVKISLAALAFAGK